MISSMIIIICIVQTAEMGVKLSEIEKLALFVACLCHDLDHRGTNNAFQSKYDDVINNYYSCTLVELIAHWHSYIQHQQWKIIISIIA